LRNPARRDYSGRFEIYAEPFPPTGDRVQVSIDGGGSVLWRRDGKELFYVERAQTLMAVDVTLSPTFKPGPPRKLFTVPGVISNGRFTVSPDGQQFLMPVQPPGVSPVTVIVDWANGLKKQR
jgi:hypothetical protein